MSREVDQRIVQMQFDNGQFEKNVETSMNTLEKLKKALNLNGAEKGFEQIQNAADSFDLSRMQSSLEKLESRFSVFGIAGMEVIQRLTDAALDLGKSLWDKSFGQIKSGGMARALKIQQAQNLITGLGYSWEEVYDTVQESVNDTAFGLDQAAIATANFLASGVENGEQLEQILRVNANLASITGRDYNDVSNLLSKVAAKGKVQGTELQQLSVMGINGLQLLSKELGATTEDISEAMRKGLITADMFFAALDNGFTDVAKSANSMYKGAHDNMMFALSKIGAKFYQEHIVNMAALFNATRTGINVVSKALDPLIAVINRIDKEVIEKIMDFLYNFQDSAAENNNLLIFVRDISQGIQTLWFILKRIAGAIGKAWIEIFPPFAWENLQDFALRFRLFMGDIYPTEKTLGNIKNAFRGLFSIFKFGISLIKGLIKIFSPFLRIIGYIGSLAINVVGFIGEIISGIGDLLSETQVWTTVAEVISTIFNTIFDWFETAIGWISEKAKNIGPVINTIVDTLKKVYEGVKPYLELIGGLIAFAFLSLVGFIESLIPTWSQVKTFFTNAWNTIKSWWETVYPYLEKAWNWVKSKLEKAGEKFGGLKQRLLEFKDNVVAALKDPKGTAEKFLQTMRDLKDRLGEVADKIKEKLSPATDTIGGFKETLTNFAQKAKENIGNKLSDLKQKLDEFFAGDTWQNLKNKFSWDKIVGFLLKVEAFLLTGILDFILIEVGRFIDGAATLMKKLGKLAEGAGKALKGVGKYFAGKGFHEKLTGISEVISSLGKSIIMIAGSIALLTFLDPTRIDKAIGTIAGLVVAVGAIAIASAKLGGKKGSALDGIQQIGIAIALIAASIAGLTFLYKDTTNTEAIAGAKSLITDFLGALAVITIAVGLLNKGNDPGKITAVLIGFGITIAIIANTIKKITKLYKTTNKDSVDKAVGAIQSILIIVGLMTALTVASTRLMGDNASAKAFIAVGLMAVLFGSSVKQIAKGIKNLQGIDTAHLAWGLGIMLVAIGGMAALTVAVSKTKKGDTLKAVGIGASLAAVILSIGYAIKLIAGFPKDQLIMSGLILSGLMAIMAVIAYAFGNGDPLKILEGAGVLAAATVPLLIVAGAIRMIASLGPAATEAAKTLGILMGAMSLLALIMGLPVVNQLLMGGAIVFDILAAGILMVGAAVYLVGEGMSRAAAAVETFIKAMMVLATSSDFIASKGESMKQAFIAMIDAIVEAVIQEAPKIALIPIVLAIEFLNGLAEQIPKLVEAVINVAKAIGAAFGMAFGHIDVLDKIEYGAKLLGAKAEMCFHNIVAAMPIAGIWKDQIDSWGSEIQGRIDYWQRKLNGEDWTSTRNQNGAGGSGRGFGEKTKTETREALGLTSDEITSGLKGLIGQAGDGGFNFDKNFASGLLKGADLPIDASGLLGEDVLSSLDLKDLSFENGFDVADYFGKGFEEGSADTEETVWRFGDMVVASHDTMIKRAEEAKEKTRKEQETIKKNFDAFISEAQYHTPNEVRKVMEYVTAELQDSKWGNEAYAAGIMVLAGLERGLSGKNSDGVGSRNSHFQNLKNQGDRAMAYALQGMRERGEINSPSKATMRMGAYLLDGLAIGMAENADVAANSARSVMEATLGAMSIDDYLNSDTSSIRPVLDLGNVRAGAAQINGVLDTQRLSLSAINGDISHEDSQIGELLGVTRQVLSAIQNGSDLYLDDDILAGRINRRLGLA